MRLGRTMRIRRRRARRMDDTTDDLRAVACIPLVLIPWSDGSKKKSQNLRNICCISRGICEYGGVRETTNQIQI